MANANTAVVGAGGTVLGVNVFAPLVRYGGELASLPPMDAEVQIAAATVIAALVTVVSVAVRTLWRNKFGGPDATDSAGA